MSKGINRKITGTAVKAVLVVLIFVFGLLTSDTHIRGGMPDNVMRAVFFDVEQGDCTLVISDGAVILTDVPLFKSEAVIGYMQRLGIKRIDWFIISHFDTDHAGDAVKVIDAFEITHLLFPEPADGSDPLYREIVAAADENACTVAKTGQSYIQGDIRIDVLAPGARGKTDNENCVACRLVYGETSLLLCSDMIVKEEKVILSKYGGGIRSDVLKVAHHGSKYSSSEEFLEAVRPEYAVISCGANRYGHPTTETLDKLEKTGAEILITQANGVIIFDFDGKNVIRKK